MKKILFGMLLGILLAIPVSIASAEVVSLVGESVEGSFPIKLGSERVEKDAIVIDETAYVPIRVISEMFNADVAFIDSEIIITPKGGLYLTDAEAAAKSQELAERAAAEQAAMDEQTRAENAKNKSVLDLQKQIKILKNHMASLQMELDLVLAGSEPNEATVKNLQDGIAAKETAIAELEAQLAEIEGQ